MKNLISFFVLVLFITSNCLAQLSDYRVTELVEEEASLIDSWVQLSNNQLLSVVGILKNHEEELNGYYIKNNEIKNFNKITRKLKRDKNKKLKKVMNRTQYKLYSFFDKNRKKSSKEYVKEIYEAIKGHPKCQQELYTYHINRVLPVYNSIGREIQLDMTNEEIFRLDSIGSSVYDQVNDYHSRLIKKKKVDLSSPEIQDSLQKVTEIVNDGTDAYKGIKAKYYESLEEQLNLVTDYRLKWNKEYEEILSKYFQGTALKAIVNKEEDVDKMGLNKELTDQTLLMLQPGAADRYVEFIEQFKSIVLEFDN